MLYILLPQVKIFIFEVYVKINILKNSIYQHYFMAIRVT
jgi:hypothetical protein